jgi:hypothetical protein
MVIGVALIRTSQFVHMPGVPGGVWPRYFGSTAIVLGVRVFDQIFDCISSGSFGKLGKELEGLAFPMFSKGISISVLLTDFRIIICLCVFSSLTEKVTNCKKRAQNGCSAATEPCPSSGSKFGLRSQNWSL